MYQQTVMNPLSADLTTIEDEVFAVVWEIFAEIGKFWKNMDDPLPHRIAVYNFALNRIKLRPVYNDTYKSAPVVIKQLKDQYGPEKAYEFLFTDQSINKSPPETAVAVVRQNIVNELISYQLALGGFKAFGAINYCGFVAGAYIENEPVPYRTFEAPK